MATSPSIDPKTQQEEAEQQNAQQEKRGQTALPAGKGLYRELMH
jgi:hypothetical protein